MNALITEHPTALLDPIPSVPLQKIGIAPLAVEPLANEDLWSNPPPWGESWGVFFKIFEGQAEGLSITELTTQCQGRAEIVTSWIQTVVEAAKRDGLIIAHELQINIDRNGNRLPYPLCKERFFLNARSERLQELMADVHEHGQAQIEKFLAIDFAKIASNCDCELINQSDYAHTFLEFLLRGNEEGAFYVSDFYKCNKLFPDPEASYGPWVVSYIDAVIKKAIELNILDQTNKNGRPCYNLLPGVRELIVGLS